MSEEIERHKLSSTVVFLDRPPVSHLEEDSAVAQLRVAFAS